MPDLALVRSCAMIALLAGCGADPVGTGGVPFPADERLTISGQVLDGEGRPLWGVEVSAVDQRTKVPPTHGFDAPRLEPRHDGTGPRGDYRVEVDAEGPVWLHFGAGERTFAWVEVDAGRQRDVDVVIAEDDVVSCQLFAADGRATISHYSWWAHGPNWGVGAGGGCLSSHGGCGPDALTFVWPGGFDSVEVHLGDAAEVVLSGWDEPCEAWE